MNRTYTYAENYATACAIVAACEARGINLTAIYKDWVDISLLLAYEFDEAGRELFHRLSQQDDRYTERECDKQYNYADKNKRGGVTLATLVRLAKDAGVDMRELDKDTHASRTASSESRPRPQPKPKPPTSYTPMKYVDELGRASRRTGNTLCEFLSALFGELPTAVAAEKYRMGSMYGGAAFSGLPSATVYPQIDSQGQCRGAKVIQYDERGHRRKDDRQRVTWLHYLLKDDPRHQGWAAGYNIAQCLFGEHLLQERPNAAVCLVEAEKTALIMSIVSPEPIWLATCGKAFFKSEVLQVLAGRQVHVFPDIDAVEDWGKRMQEMKQLASGWRMIPWWRSAVGELGDKDDIADHILRAQEALCMRDYGGDCASVTTAP